MRILTWALLLPGLVWAIVRIGGLEAGRAVQLIAFTPYVAAGSILLAAVILAFRRWRPGIAAAAIALALVVPRILLGDFNATLDSARLRALVASGYRDAAATVGGGLIGTWGPYYGHMIPPVTLDHVLVDDRIGVRGLDVHGLVHSDHRAVLILPEVAA